jgi:excisionase family DNA binding protein
MVPITEAARQLGTSRTTLDRLARAKKLKKYRKAGDRRVYVDLEAARSALGFTPIEPP